MFNLGYTLTIVILGTMLLGGISGMLGTFVVLRRQALIGDALSHATLPGVMIAYMLINVRDLEVLLIGAFVSAFVAMVLLDVIKNYTRIKFDTSMALILSSFFGFGQVLLSHIQKTGAASQAGLSRFIFGQAATMLRADVYMITLIALIVFITVMVFWKELKLYIFDEAFFKAMGLSARVASGLITVLVVIIIVIGIRMVGVILMSALLIAPSVAARQFTNRFYLNVAFSGLIGSLGGIIGTYLSATRANMPTGPVIVIVLGTFVIVAIMFSPRTGLIKRYFQNVIYKKRVKRFRKLIHLYEHPSQTYLDETEAQYFLSHDYVMIEDGNVKITRKGMARIRSIKAVHVDES